MFGQMLVDVSHQEEAIFCVKPSIPIMAFDKSVFQVTYANMLKEVAKVIRSKS